MTTCPPEIAEVLLAMLETGLLRIRALAWSGQADRCAIEADHLHNLPGLLADYSPERLHYYWDVERVSYIDQDSEDQCEGWGPLWQRLYPHVERISASPKEPSRALPRTDRTG